MTKSLPPENLADLWRQFAAVSVADYSPTYHAFVVAAADNTDVMNVVRSAPEDTHMPNNLQAAVHCLVLEGLNHPITRWYDRGLSADLAIAHAGADFCDAVLGNARRVVELMSARPVQTNEVGRIGIIGPTLNLIGQRHHAPIALIDAGTSAGLNLGFDKWRIHYSGAHSPVSLGPEANPSLHLNVDSVGLAPIDTPAEVTWRRGFDRNPIDVTDPTAALWLRSLVWPGHDDRQARLDAAIDHARQNPPELMQAQALDGLEQSLAAAPADSLAVVLTTWVAYYFDSKLREAFDTAIANAGRPVVWASMEVEGVVRDIPVNGQPNEDLKRSVVGLVTADGTGRATREFVGWCHSHGGWFDLRLAP